MRLDEILNDVVDSVTGRGNRSERDVQSAQNDPYGDPADLEVQDSSHDPYGDPADTYNGQQVADSSQDPYGDPADAEQPAHSGGLLGRLFGR